MQLMRNVLLFVGGMSSALFLLASCRSSEEKSVETAAHGLSIKTQSTIVEPPVSKGKWRAVVVAVSDRKSGKELICEVAVGSQVAVPASDISIAVDNFLPDFTMQGTVLTSESNELKNPAARIRVFEGGKEIFKGWLFSLFPTTHSFQHPRYSFTLKGFIPAK